MFNLFKKRIEESWNLEDEIQYQEFLKQKFGEISRITDFVIVKGKLRKLVMEKIQKESQSIDYDEEFNETLIIV